MKKEHSPFFLRTLFVVLCMLTFVIGYGRVAAWNFTGVGKISTVSFEATIFDRNLANASVGSNITIGTNAGCSFRTGRTIAPETTSFLERLTQSFSTATSNPCYTFDDWVVDENNAGKTVPYTFENVSSNHTIPAVNTLFTYNITSSTGENGKISPLGNAIVNCDASKVDAITPNSGYVVDEVFVDGVSVGPCLTRNGVTFSTSDLADSRDPDSGESPSTTIKLASVSSGGSISTTTTGVSAGNVLVRFRAKGWSGSETNVTLAVDGQSILITDLTSAAFGWVERLFTSVAANPTITFSTIQDNIVHIGNVEIYCNVQSTDYTWNGATDTSWSTATNWTPNGVPTSIDNVTINVPGTKTLNINSSITINNFIFNGIGTFNASAAAVLIINGDVTYGGTANANLDCASQVFITSNQPQPVPPLTYGNLDVLGGARTFSPTGIIKICSGFNVNPDLYSYTVTGSTVEYIATSSYNIRPFQYHHLRFSGPASFNFAASAPTGDKSVNVQGDFTQSSGTVIIGSTGSNITALNVIGNMIVSGGTFDVNKVGTSKGSVNLRGNLTVANNATLGATSTTLANTNFNFSGTAGTQTIDVANSTSLNNITFNINSGSYVKLINQNLSLGGNSKFNVLSGGTLDFGFDGVYDGVNSAGLNALNITNHVNSAVFKTEANATLKITSPAGVTSTVNLGNVQTTSTTRTYDAGTIYHYIGKANQATGNGLPNGLTNTLIVDLDTDSTNENASFTSTGTTKLNSTGTLEIRKGKVIDAPSNGFRNNVVENEDGESDIQKGNIIMTGGRYVISGSGTKPSLSGAYTFNGGTVEFTGTAATKIRTSSPAKQYLNVDVSGTNVETGGKNFIVNNLLKVTSTGKLTIPEVADDVAPYVVTVKKGIQVADGGEVFFSNNAQLIQDSDAVNSGSITAQRNMTLTAERKEYNYLISPLIGQPLKSIFGGLAANVPFVIRYNEATDLFPNAGVDVYIPGKAYAVKEPIMGVTLQQAEFKGVPQNGDVFYPLDFTDAQHGNNLVGNPYPSNINIKKLYEDNIGTIGENFKFWDNKANAIYTQQGPGYKGAAYANFNAASGTNGTGTAAPGNTVVDPTNPGSPAGMKIPNHIVKVGQGFMVKAKIGGPLQFTNDQRITSQAASQFFGRNKEIIEDDRYWLELSTPSSLVISNAVVYFENGTNEFSKDDTQENGSSDALFTVATAEKVVINGRSPFTIDDVLPLGTRHFAAGLHHIQLGKKEGVFANGQNIYLKDKQTGIVTNLCQNSYTFSADAGETNGRFEIIYQPGTVLAADGAVKESLHVYRNGVDFVVRSSQSKIDKVEVYDASGRLLQSVKERAFEVRINASLISSGIYFLKININSEIINKKIIK